MPHDDGAIRITTASSSRHEDIAARQRRYVVSMSLRTVCFIGAVIADGWLRWVLVAGAVLLPYFAVVMANADGSGGPQLVAQVATRSARGGAMSTGIAWHPIPPP